MIKLDAIDLKILAALQSEGRMTKVKLAEAVNLSVSPCWERLRRLEREGVISGYRAEIDLSKLVRAAMVWVEISLTHHRHEDFEAFERHINDMPEVVECWATGGTTDYLMRVVTPHMDAYQELIEQLLAADLGIDRYVTCVVTKRVKKPSELPIASLINGLRKAD
ncbi:MAG TPA: Lrp/AsnC family transcriptional regulator [Magnetovibrio sp.]